ncbi:hypothetical protein E1B28_005104 [Marasmius oreades]|uniref:Uncharacterized protein n=1 Tax=Marasmius oreades TaxID=181124 RepID=A0A9P8ADZ1_9AGAR|nr:uncharacterized protein E1B28_005104 [Marasmius oreades]KAG7097785.1 hypothetical protein E1B28_005104 [Marasmius oreades]
MLSELSEQTLLKNIPPEGFPAEITYTDGRVASLHPRTHEYITSPNSPFISLPPFGSTRDLYRREDGFYGVEDPALWPQPFNRANAYLPCIPCRPTAQNHPYFDESCIWGKISTESMEYIDRNRREGVLQPAISAPFEHVVKHLRTRTEAYRGSTRKDHDFLALLTEFDNNLTVCLTRISRSPMSLRDIRRGVAELQRSWLYSVAVLDYMEKFRSRTLGKHEREHAEFGNRISAFVWNDRDALEL